MKDEKFMLLIVAVVAILLCVLASVTTVELAKINMGVQKEEYCNRCKLEMIKETIMGNSPYIEKLDIDGNGYITAGDYVLLKNKIN